MKRRQFLRLAPAGAAALALAACGEQKPSSAQETAGQAESVTLDYAKQFTAKRWQNGAVLLTVGDSDSFLVLPEGAAVPADAPQADGSGVILQQPVENIYLVSSSVMDMFIALDALGSVGFSGTKAENWHLPAAREAMESGSILYAGKYSAPDYERILAGGCTLAVENTMIYHTPEVKEELEQFGIPVIVERSSYENGPLARMEWIKFYGLLLGLEAKAGQVFAAKLAQIEPLLGAEPTGKTVAFFSITSNGLATVRKGSDYVAQMIELAGGSYAFAGLTDDSSNLATMNLPLEDFYAGARDADILIYNGSIEGEVETLEQLVSKYEMLADFKAVQTGDVWCTGQNLFQHSMEMTELMLDMNLIFTQGKPADSELNFLRRVI